MLRVRVSSTGWVGGPALNTFYFTFATEDLAAATTAAVRVRGAWEAGKAFMAAGVVATVNPQVDVIDPTTGNVTASFITVPGANVLGNTGSGGRAAPGLCVLLQLKTDIFLEGRRVAGRCYFSGLDTSAVATDGTPATIVETAISALANALAGADLAAGLYVVWRRPRLAGTNAQGPVSARAGSTAPVVSHAIPNKFALMRSRRD
jgi:hypothetical protein